MAAITVIAVALVLINTIVDILSRIIDPRIS
jgi:ABC-type dipeptide/oligopeptide/nickel transport system permease component